MKQPTKKRALAMTPLTEDANVLSVDDKPAGARRRSSPVEVQSAQERHDQRKSWFLAEAAKQAPNRALMAKCEAYYDSRPWTREDAEEVRSRGQNPVVYNEIKPTIDWLIGTERRSRVDFYVMAEDDDEQAEEDAQNKTKLLKYLDDVNRAGFERSYAAEDMFKAGVGWLEVGLRGDKTNVPIFVGAESWRNILWDSSGNTRRDLSNSRYMFRIRVTDYDIALCCFPDKKVELERCVQTGDSVDVFRSWLAGNGLIAGLDAFGANQLDELDYMTSKPVDLFNPRKRVMLLECWSREPQRRALTDEGLGDPVTFKMRCSIMTEYDTLIEAWSPFRHEHFPFIPMWAYLNRQTGLPYSPIYPLLGPQEALNHRMSKSLYEASMNQLKIEAGALDESMDMEEVREELNSPDGIAVFANGALSGGRVQERPSAGKSAEQLQLAERDVMSIRSMSGIDTAARGLQSNLSSGVALKTNNDNTTLLNAELFDNLLLGRQLEGDITLSLAEQFVKAPMTIRVAGDGRKAERLKINAPQADGTYANDITTRRAHFVVGEQAWKQSYAEAAFETLMQVMTQLASAAPQVVINLLDVIFEMHPNLPRKQAILARIRSVNGQSDPDGKMTPEQQAEQQQKAAIAKAQFDAQMAKLQADIRHAQAQGTKLEADALLVRLEALYTSAQAAQVLVQIPGATPVADALLAAAGFQPEQGDPQALDPNIVPPATPQQPGMPAVQAPPLQLAGGAMQGIETPRADGIQPQPSQQPMHPEGV